MNRVNEAKPVIAVDIDDVLVPHAESFIRMFNEKYGTQLTLADNHSVDPRVFGVETIEEAVRRVQSLIHTPEFLAGEPTEEAVEALRKLSENYNLAVVTARDTIIEKVTRDWLDEYFSEIVNEAHFTARYNLEGKSRPKAEVCQEIGAIALIDDSPVNAIEVARSGTKVLLFGDYPWNQKYEQVPGITRVKNWQEVLEYFDAAAG